jgi:hypothetical protein
MRPRFTPTNSTESRAFEFQAIGSSLIRQLSKRGPQAAPLFLNRLTYALAPSFVGIRVYDEKALRGSPIPTGPPKALQEVTQRISPAKEKDAPNVWYVQSHA